MTILIISLATTVQAGEVKIVETESGVVAEYTGAPSSAGSDAETPSAAVNDDNAKRVKYLTSQIEQLQTEKADILNLSGNETEDELALANVLADEKKKQIEAYVNEIKQLTGNAGKNEAETAQPREDQPLKQKNYRQEKKRQLKELRKLQMPSPTSEDSQ